MGPPPLFRRVRHPPLPLHRGWRTRSLILVRCRHLVRRYSSADLGGRGDGDGVVGDVEMVVLRSEAPVALVVHPDRRVLLVVVLAPRGGRRQRRPRLLLGHRPAHVDRRGAPGSAGSEGPAARGRRRLLVVHLEEGEARHLQGREGVPRRTADAPRHRGTARRLSEEAV